MPSEHVLPILPFERITKKAGVVRLSREAAEELREIIEELAISIAERATRVALHAGRKTVTNKDIEFVTGKIQQNVAAIDKTVNDKTSNNPKGSQTSKKAEPKEKPTEKKTDKPEQQSADNKV